MKIFVIDALVLDIGSSKKEGQQNAAKMALILYGYLKDDQFENSDIFYPDWEKIDSSGENDDDSNYIYQTNDNDSLEESVSNNTIEQLEKEKEINDDNSVCSDLSEETDSD
jgi:hypothetical protein